MRISSLYDLPNFPLSYFLSKSSHLPSPLLPKPHPQYSIPYHYLQTNKQTQHNYPILTPNSNGMNTVHGGCISTIFDACTSVALMGRYSEEKWGGGGVSRGLSVTFIKGIVVRDEGDNDVLVECEVVGGVGKRNVVLRGEFSFLAFGSRFLSLLAYYVCLARVVCLYFIMIGNFFALTSLLSVPSTFHPFTSPPPPDNNSTNTPIHQPSNHEATQRRSPRHL